MSLTFWTVPQLAHAAGLAPNTVRWHCRHGRLQDDAYPTASQWLIPDEPAQSFIRWAKEKWSAAS